MPKEKTKARAKAKKAPATDIQKQPEAPEKKGGPLPATRSVEQLEAAGSSPGGSAGRAQMMSDLQGSVGNTRLSRVLDQEGDESEREADRVARRVADETPPGQEGMGAPEEEPAGARPPGIQRAAEEEDRLAQRQPAAQAPRTEEEDKPVQMKPQSTAAGATVGPDVEAGIKQARSGGQPLPKDVRVQMEQKFGADLSGVKVHTDEEADRLASSLNARAFTIGQDIFFKQGEYSPDTTAGRELLGHELAHVVQQSRSGSRANNAVQRRLFVSGAVEAEVNEYLSVLGDAAGHTLSWSFRRPRVRITGNTAAGPTSESARRMLRTVIGDRTQHAEIHVGSGQPRVSIGAFPGAGSAIQNVDIDDIRNLNASLPGQGTAKAYHEMMENYHSHAAGAPGFGPSHQVGIEAESDVLEESGIAGRRLARAGVRTPIPAPPGQPTGPNIRYERNTQEFTHYFLDMVRRITTGGGGTNFEIVSATRRPKVQVSQRTVDRFQSGSSAIPATGNAALNATLADLNANPNATLEIEGFADSVGSQRANRRLTRRRTESVRAFFTANGINASRIAIVGRGETSFVAPNNTAAGRAQNRRVVVTVHRP